MLKEINILDELCREEERLLRTAQKIIHDASNSEQIILKDLGASKGNPNQGEYTDEILLSEEAIRTICTVYRLRCLPSKYFKKEIPYEALIRINELQRKHSLELKEFCIVAPAEMFSLEDELKDPVLLAPLENGQYLFIHKWGKDLSSFRKIACYPFRTFGTFLQTLVIAAILLTAMTPWNWIVRDHSVYQESMLYYRIMLFGCMVTWIFVISFYFGFVTRRNFSAAEWNNYRM